jgi:di/tricarboxylate transporter
VNAQQLFVLAALALLVTLLVRGRQAPAVVFSGVAFAFLLAGLVDTPRALAAFANPGLATVVVLLLVSVVLDKSRLLEQMADRLVRGPYRWALIKLTLATSLYSAFLNNTAVVASLIGPLRAIPHHPASRLLMPMCFAATVGGTLTLVGTSTNLLVASFMLGHGLPALHIFDLLPVGLCLLVVSLAVMAVAFPTLMRARPDAQDRPADYFVEARVMPGSALAGRSVEAGGLRHLGHLFLAEIVRDGRLIAPVVPEEVVAEGDLLVFAGDVTRLDLLARFGGLELAGQRHGLPMDNLVEVIVSHDATIARRSVRELDFRARFDASVVAVRRGDRRLGGSLGDLVLQAGDALVLAVGPDFDKRNEVARNFVVVSRRQVAKFMDPRKGLVAVGAFLAVVLAASLGAVEFLVGLLVLLALFLGIGFTRLDELRRHVPYPLMFVIGSALVISEVMLATGTAQMIADLVLAGFGRFGPIGALAGVLLLTWVLTELMTNNAAAALVFPVALGIAESLGLNAMPFVMAVIYGASASFLTPYGYQTNLMIMAPGQYALADYLRAGAPVAAAYLVTALATIPMFFPL